MEMLSGGLQMRNVEIVNSPVFEGRDKTIEAAERAGRSI
jgi:hypothetical protein